MKIETKIELGEVYHDKVTNFIGVATACCVYLEDCIQVCIEPIVDGKNKTFSRWFSETRLVKGEFYESEDESPVK
jgi:hypothetical protein